MRFLFLLLFFFLISLSNPTLACLNDRDTLGEEARGLPDLMKVITGRFERNPPLYYEMRITRVTQELEQHPERLSDYNDIAVAYDRVGRDDDAIEWLGLKRQYLDRLPRTDPGFDEEWYTYWANIGTCRVHRWIRAGADQTKIGEVVRSRNEILEALKIKPDAHFGREKYQVRVMEWIIDPEDPGASGMSALGWKIMEGGGKRTDMIRGLSGLIVLGNAWESPDIFIALADLNGMGHKTKHLEYLCRLRARELESKGHHSLVPSGNARSANAVSRSWSEDSAIDEKEYRTLRREADTWQARRTAFMMERLKAGRHPDTDPEFWAGYVETAPPEIPIPWERRIELWGRPMFGFGWFPRNIFALLLIAPFIAYLGYLVRRDWRARKLRQATANFRNGRDIRD